MGRVRLFGVLSAGALLLNAWGRVRSRSEALDTASETRGVARLRYACWHAVTLRSCVEQALDTPSQRD